MARRSRTLVQKSLILFPAIALVVSVGCASATGSSEGSRPPVKKSTTTIATKKKKKKVVPPTTVVKGATSATDALSVLSGITVQNEYKSGYSRTLFKHWIDQDADSCNTREEVLIAESQSRAQVDAFGCKVIAGDWLSPYDNVTHSDPSGLDIDHMVPLKEAWDSGAWSWTSAQRQSFANDLSDPRSLIAVTASQNRSKGDKDPSNWLPPVATYRCEYLANWIAIKARWNLSMDSSEFGRIKNVITTSCPGLSISGGKGTASGTASAPANTPGTSPVVQTTAPPNSSGPPTITPGAFCSPEGARGVYNGNSYVCSTTSATGTPYKNGTKHWRRG